MVPDPKEPERVLRRRRSWGVRVVGRGHATVDHFRGVAEDYGHGKWTIHVVTDNSEVLVYEWVVKEP